MPPLFRQMFALIFACLFALPPAVAVAEETNPTMLRAESFFKSRDVGEAFDRFQKLEKEFTKDLPREKQIRFNQWNASMMLPIIEAAWKKEWEGHPESHPAFVAYIRDKMKREKPNYGFDPEKLDGKELFDTYLNAHRKSFEKTTEEIPNIERELAIPKDLIDARKHPDSFPALRWVYGVYLTLESHKKRAKERAEDEARAIAARKAIVPVPRDSKEYRDAFENYKNAVKALKAAIEKAKKDDPAWARARHWMEHEQLGSSGNARRLEKEFLNKINEEQKTVYGKWRTGFETRSSRERLEKEWKKKPASRKAIIFVLDALLQNVERNRKEQNTLTDSEKRFYDEWRKIDKSDENLAFDYLLKMYDKPGTDGLEKMEKELGITQDYKNEILKEENNNAFFLIYETYARVKQPEAVTQADKKESACIDRLNALRPNWAAEENIERFRD